MQNGMKLNRYLFDSQAMSRLPGGWEKPTRGIPTGGVQDQGYRSVPVVSNTTALTPNTTATVTLTCAPGECISV